MHEEYREKDKKSAHYSIKKKEKNIRGAEKEIIITCQEDAEGKNSYFQTCTVEDTPAHV